MLLAGCGTTVPVQGSAMPDAGVATPGGAVGTGLGGQPRATAATGGRGGASQTAQTTVGATEGPASAAATETKTTVATRRAAPYKVGLLYSSNAQAALGALGARGDVGDWKAEGDAVVGYINAHGGMGGRRLVAEWYNADATQKSSDIGNAACVAWTQDDHVDGAVPGGSIVDMNSVRSCLAKTSTPAISTEYHVQTRQRGFAENRYWVEPFGIAMESYAKTYVDGLAAQGFFNGAKLGVLYDDGADWTTVERTVLERELSRLHVGVAARASYELRDFSQVGSAEPAIDAAVLQFKSKGVNRVISFEPWVGWGFFMIAANQQKYLPTYGLSSQTAWTASYATGLVPDEEMTNAYYVGWSPVLDLKSPGPQWPRLRLCDAIYQAAGIQRNGALAEAIALSTCDGLLDLAALGDAVGGALTSSTFARAVADVSWQSALVPRMSVSPARPYGITLVRPARWRTSCECFVYTGPAAAATR
jgi:hypothetical protein